VSPREWVSPSPEQGAPARLNPATLYAFGTTAGGQIVQSSGALDVLPLPTQGDHWRLAPGEDPALVSRRMHRGGMAVVIGAEELVFVNGIRQRHCRIPVAPSAGKPRWPLATKLVHIIIHHPAVGADSPVRLVHAIDSGDNVVATLNASKTWEMRSDSLGQMASAAGMKYELYVFDQPYDFLQAFPRWADPMLEFQVDHPSQENVREVADAVSLIAASALVFGGPVMIATLATPIGPFYRGLIVASGAVFLAITLWARNRRRMRRSLRKAGHTGVSVSSGQAHELS
jgi:hypothetical protein